MNKFQLNHNLTIYGQMFLEMNANVLKQKHIGQIFTN